MSNPISYHIVDRQGVLRALAIDSLIAIGFGALVSLSIVWGWWPVVIGLPVVGVFTLLAVQARQEILMLAYIFVLTLLACLQVSIWKGSVPGFYAAVGLGRYILMGGLVVWALVLFRRHPTSLKAFDFAWLTLLGLVAISAAYSGVAQTLNFMSATRGGLARYTVTGRIHRRRCMRHPC